MKLVNEQKLNFLPWKWIQPLLKYYSTLIKKLFCDSVLVTFLSWKYSSYLGRPKWQKKVSLIPVAICSPPKKVQIFRLWSEFGLFLDILVRILSEFCPKSLKFWSKIFHNILKISSFFHVLWNESQLHSWK